ncbi:hypothetical protein SLS58_011246 [Diplodia intermedia]|uniref:Uncharacterized protein n=1 Tax=Diplodia intermedia TaxID=856260 RepID=A0ABR3T0A9_9PEZI
MADFLDSSDLDEVMGGLAHSITGIVQSEDNFNLTMLAGDAIGPMVFVKVHWQWLAYPVAIELLVVCLLVICIIKSSSSPLLLKSSALALLFHSLEGWTKDELVVAKTEGAKVGRETAQDLCDVAKGMNARLERNADGEFMFVKAN